MSTRNSIIFLKSLVVRGADTYIGLDQGNFDFKHNIWSKRALQDGAVFQHIFCYLGDSVDLCQKGDGVLSALFAQNASRIQTCTVQRERGSVDIIRDRNRRAVDTARVDG